MPRAMGVLTRRKKTGEGDSLPSEGAAGLLANEKFSFKKFLPFQNTLQYNFIWFINNFRGAS